MRLRVSAPASKHNPSASRVSLLPSCTESIQISTISFNRHWRGGTGCGGPIYTACADSSPSTTSSKRTLTCTELLTVPNPAWLPTPLYPIHVHPRPSLRPQSTHPGRCHSPRTLWRRTLDYPQTFKCNWDYASTLPSTQRQREERKSPTQTISVNFS